MIEETTVQPYKLTKQGVRDLGNNGKKREPSQVNGQRHKYAIHTGPGYHKRGMVLHAVLHSLEEALKHGKNRIRNALGCEDWIVMYVYEDGKLIWDHQSGRL